MRFVYDDGDTEAELDLEVRVADPTVADLAAALGLPSGPLRIGAHTMGPELDLAEAGFHEGVTVARADAAAGAARAPVPVVDLALVGGLVAGGRTRLVPGSFTVGRAPDNDVVVDHPTVSARHCEVTVDERGSATVADLGSHNGTWVDDVAVAARVPVGPAQLLRLGAVLARVAPPAHDDRSLAVDPLRHVGAAGTIPFNRPPRPAPPHGPPELDVPVAPPSSSTPSPLSVAGIVAPLVMGGAMVVAYGNPLFALFMLLSPVMAVASWLESRRRAGRSRAAGSRAARADLDRFAGRLEVAAREAAQRRWEEVPDPAELLRWAAGPSVRTWERRPGHPDFLLLHAGTGDVPWSPPLGRRHGEPPAGLDAVLAAHSTLPRTPVHVDLADGGVVGLVGDRTAALAVARSLLCQAVVQTGPADLTVVVACDPGRVADWDWAKWLPHTRDPAGDGDTRLLLGDRDRAEVVLRELAARGSVDDRVTLCVLDADGITGGRNAPARSVLRGDGGPAAGIVVAETEHELPALCTSVVHLRGPDGAATLHRPQEGEVVHELLAAGLSDGAARRCARSLAPFEDPELALVGAGLPGAVSLVGLLGLDPFDPAALLAAWRRRDADAGLVAPLGMGGSGPILVDLVRDGPHGLIGGTTGSGKSELLRSLVAALAVSAHPDHLTFVLVDYKGGAAFDECARLPHTVGLVTDLDHHLGERALRCLEAELRHRERRLRAVGATDLPGYLALPSSAGEPMPRLVVVIDEFATLKAELPDFVESLVGIAQRGRSLGVHLLLATQRPSGAVSENIRANANLRIALRVQDGGDSSDIIGTTQAAGIARGQAGRAFVRLGPGEVVPVQTALVTGHTDVAATAAVDLAPFRFGPRARPVARASADAGGDRPSDLARLVDAARSAFDRSGAAPPRRPWPEPLPAVVDLGSIDDPDAAARGVVPVALADDPDRQRQDPAGWDRRAGNLLLYGIGGSGVTTTLASIALTLARLEPPDRLHLYVLDGGAGGLAALAGLHHTGAVVGAPERERQERFVAFLRTELDRRRGLPHGGRDEPEIVVLLDGFGTFADELDDVAGMAVLDAFQRVVADGPGLGIRTVIGADRVGAVPSAIGATIAQKWLFRLADGYDYGAAGVAARAVPAPRPGQAVVAPEGRVVQVGLPRPDLAVAVAAVAAVHPRPVRGPAAVGRLPDNVDAAPLAGEVRVAGTPWFLPVGIGGDSLTTVGFSLYEGEHALIAGPPRSGRSTALSTTARLLRSAGAPVGLVGLATGRSPLSASDDLDRLVTGAAEVMEAVDELSASRGACLLLIDDVERVDDADGVLERLVLATRSDVHVVAAGRTDTLRSAYGHWTRSLRRSKVGVLLQPAPDLDGELFSVSLPRRAPVAMRPGRGWLVAGGELEVVQLAREVRSQAPLA